jgi:alanine-synthesizing transaminase
MELNRSWIFAESPLDELHARGRELQGKGQLLIDCSMINPDLTPPRLLLDKLVEAAMKPVTHRYAVSRGIRRLREAFTNRYQRVFGVALDSESECCVTLGAKDGVLNFLRAAEQLGTLRAGDPVLLPFPCYPAHRAAVMLCGFTPVYFQVCDGEGRGDLSVEFERALQATKAKVALLNFPHNPTGLVISASEVESLLKISAVYGTTVLNDFAYGELTAAGPDGETEAASSFLAVARTLKSSGGTVRVVEAYTMSKAFSVPGWRIAALLGDAAILRAVVRIKSWSDYGQFLPVQSAAAAGLEASQELIGEARRAYGRRTATLSQGLSRLGWSVPVIPRAGAFVWCRPNFPQTSATAARILLDQHGIVSMPGELFGEGLETWVRLATVVPEETVREILRRFGTSDHRANATANGSAASVQGGAARNSSTTTIGVS